MAKLLPVLLLAVFLTFVIARFTSQPPKIVSAPTEDPVVKTDSTKYWIVIVRAGENYRQHNSPAALVQQAHTGTLRYLREEGKLIAAGPFTEKQELQNVLIMECRDSLEAVRLLERDSAISNGWLKAEIRPCRMARDISFK